jgi:hypothetical protein
MYNRYSDFAELRPTGEASHIPDTRLGDECEGAPRRQRVATSSGGYPDVPTAADGECRSCGASVPDGQTKCRFCLTNHLGIDSDRITTGHVISDDTVEEITDAAQNHDLIVVGETEPSLVDRIVGDVLTKVADQSNRPVLVVRDR